MTFDEVLQEPSRESKLEFALELLLYTIEDANTIEEILVSEEYLNAKRLVKY